MYMIFIINIPVIMEYKEIDYSYIEEVKYINNKPIYKIDNKVTNNYVSNNTSINLVNNTREELGLSPVIRTSVLDVSATNKCQHMDEHGYWAHSGGGKNWWDFVAEAGGNAGNAGEILGKHYVGNPQGLHQAWLNSPTHYAVMATAHYTRVGFAECGVLSVMHFD